MIETGTILQQRYRIDRQIGQGGMGAVYVATDERFGSIVAIKETLCMDDNYRKAIEREARLLNSLKHPALPRVSDHFIEETGQFLVMEYIPGEDLFEIMEARNAPFDVEQVLDWADQLLDALDFLHNQENPVIHRDIKPQNLKAVPGGKITLLDFGLAKGNPTDAANKTAAKSIFGYSRNYASLEQIQGTGTDPRSDLYSLAATLYHLLTNAPPEDALTRAMAVLSRQPDPLLPASEIEKGVPKGVAGVLQNAMDLNSGVRPASAAEMRQMLREYEKYEHFADVEAADPRPIDPSVFAQKTKLMPATTRAAGDLQTDVATRLLPNGDSEVTSVRNTHNGAAGSSRRFAFTAAGLVALLLGGTAIGGIYVFEGVGFLDETGEQQMMQMVPPPKPPEPEFEEFAEAEEAEEAEGAETGDVQTAAAAKAGNTIAKNRDSSKTAKAAQPIRKKLPPDPGEVRIEGDTVYLGDMKITELGIETPTEFIGESGVVPRMHRTPPVPPANGTVFKGLTPEQLRKLRIFRNSVNTSVHVKPKSPKNKIEY